MVAKSGRTTGLTCAAIGSIMDTVSVQYSTNCDGTGIIFTITYANQVSVTGGDFSSAGDSGSLTGSGGRSFFGGQPPSKSQLAQVGHREP